MPADKNAVTITGAAVATMAPPGQPGEQAADYGLIPDAALVIEDQRVAWIGPRDNLPARWEQVGQYSVAGGLITPGLVECHAQLLFGGGRPAEQGAAGIHAVAAATHCASDDDLLATAARRAWWLIRQGVTTLEVKTGYGLDTGGELRLLRLAGQLRDVLPVQVRVTLLAGHTYPPDADDNREEYVIGICDELLPAAIGLGILDDVEVYCEEEGGISMEDASTILETVYRKKIPTRVAADQLSDSAGGALAPAFYSKAAVYLNHTDDIAVTAMGKAGTIAVLVPATALDPGSPPGRPPVGPLREQQVPIAVSAGLNPVTSPLADPLAAAYLGCVLHGLTRREALHGITAAAARALALTDGTGTLVAGGPADLVIWDAAHPEELVSWPGAPLCQEVWAAGQPVAHPGPDR